MPLAAWSSSPTARCLRIASWSLLDSASGCGAGLLGRLRPEQPLLDDYWMPASTCPRAVDVGGTSLFLVAPESSYITGHILAIDGGWTAGFARDF